jgi:hypothetical protein
VLTGLVLLTVTLTAILIHLTWFYAARRNVADVVRQLNRQIVGSVQHEVRGTLNDAWSVQEAVRSIFFQEAVKPTDEAKREFIFLALPRSHPTLSWIALGFPDGAFFGALRTTDDEIDMVEVKQNPATGIRRQRVDTYTPQPGDVMFREREITPSNYEAAAQTWYQRAVAENGPGIPSQHPLDHWRHSDPNALDRGTGDRRLPSRTVMGAKAWQRPVQCYSLRWILATMNVTGLEPVFSTQCSRGPNSANSWPGPTSSVVPSSW